MAANSTFRCKNWRSIGEGTYGSVFRQKAGRFRKQGIVRKHLKPKDFQTEQRIVSRLIQAQCGNWKNGGFNIVRYYKGRIDLCELHMEDWNRCLGKLLQDRNFLPRCTFSGVVKNKSLVLKLIDGVLSGLGYLHGIGIVHRDVKPSNVLCKGYHVKLCDFGGGCMWNMKTGKLSFKGNMQGAWSFRAPEGFSIAIDKAMYSPKLDIFSSGCLFFTLMTNRLLTSKELNAYKVKREIKNAEASDYKRIIESIFERVDGYSVFKADYPRSLLGKRWLKFVRTLCRYEPTSRPNARDALQMLRGKIG